MKRPVSHQTEDQAKLIFRRALPPEWVVREQHSDYGVDLEVEVFRAGSSTGTIIKVQVKGTEVPRFNAARSCIAWSLSTDSGTYLCEELQVPAVLAVVDVAASRAYWTAPQVDGSLRGAVRDAVAAKRKTVTVYIPLSNVLPQTVDALVGACAQAQIRLGVGTVTQAPVPVFVTAVAGAYDPNEVATALATQAAAVRVQQMHDLYERDDLVEARSILESIVAAPDASPVMKFNALLHAEKWEILQLHYPPDTQDMEPRLRLRFAERMRQVSAGAPVVLRLHAAIAQKAAECQLLASEDVGLYMSWAVHQAAHDPVGRLFLAYRRRQVATRLLRKYRQCGRLVNFALRSGHPAVVPDGAHRIAMSLMLLIPRLDWEGLEEAAESYRNSLLQLAEIGIEVAVAGRRWTELGLIASDTFLILASRKEPGKVEAAAAWAERHLQAITDDAHRSACLELLHKHKAGLLAEQGMSARYDREAIERQTYSNMAKALGIDVADPDDPMAVRVRRGLADLNPERALRNCTRLFITLGPAGLPGLLIRLQTAGPKRLHCTLYGHTTEALALDDCYLAMQRQFCDACPDRAPHAPEWRWSAEWQEEQNALHGHLANDRSANG